MALVRLIRDEDADPQAREILEAGRERVGTILEAWRALAHRADLLEAHQTYIWRITAEGSLDQRVKELVAVQVCRLNRCRYTTSHRVRSARAAGVPDDDLVELARGGAGLPESERLALEFATQLTLKPPAATTAEIPAGVDDELLAQLKETFTDEQIVDLALTVSLWNGLSRFHRVMQFELDMEPAPSELVDRL